MKIKCIIVDDEPLARKGLSEYISELDFLELAGECENAIAAHKALNEQKIDLVFLDIQMPKITGLDFLKTLRVKPMVILTTAYSEYAIQGYELDVLDYLLKPIAFDRFVKAAHKAKEFYDIKANTGTAIEIRNDYFFIRCDSRFEKIFFNELVYAEALENYVVIHTTTDKFITYLTFKSLEEYLPKEAFIKVHKSFIVSVSKIGRIEGNEIKAGAHTIPISRSLKDDVMQKIVNNNLLKR